MTEKEHSKVATKCLTINHLKMMESQDSFIKHSGMN